MVLCFRGSLQLWWIKTQFFWWTKNIRDYPSVDSYPYVVSHRIDLIV